MLNKELSFNLPRLSKIKSYRKILDEQIKGDLLRIDNGYFVDVKKSISEYCSHFVSVNKNIVGDIKIKLSADGTQVGRNITLINFTFQIIGLVNKKNRSVNYVKTLGIAQCHEDYQQLESIYSYLMKCVAELTQISHNDKIYPIKYYYTADWKLLSIVLGLFGPQGNYPCLWCHWLKTKSESDNGKVTQPPEAPEGPRSIDLQSKYHGQKIHFGYKNKSLLNNIMLKNIIIDTLHLKLRICDKLTNLLIRELCVADEYEGKGLFDYNKHSNLTRWINFIRNDCKIKREIIPFNKENSACITRDFTGKEYDKILSKIDIVALFPSLDNNAKIQELWSKFKYILESIRKTDWEAIKCETDAWYKTYIYLYTELNVTPYIHAFKQHLYEQIRNHGDITQFDQQGVEKLNDFTTQEYFNATNKFCFSLDSNNLSNDFIMQLLIRRCRIDYYVLNNEIILN